MRDTFTPDSDAVYLAQGAVPPHDNVVTERISAPSRFWYSQGSRNARRRRSPDCASSWHEEGELLFSSEQKFQVIATVTEWLGATEMTGRSHFLPRLSTQKHFTKRGRAAAEAAARGAEPLIRMAVPPVPFVATPYVSVFSRLHRKTRPRSLRRE